LLILARVLSRRLDHEGEAGIRVHYASKSAAHRGSRRVPSDHGAGLVRDHSSEDSHGWKAFREAFRRVQDKGQGEQGCLVADLRLGMENEGLNRSAIGGRTRLN